MRTINDAPWPENDLEYLGQCPVCGNQSRRLLYADLADNVFFCAPGKWKLHQCLNCSAAYLDPRPSASSMHVAYQNYFTHTRPQEAVQPSSRAATFRRSLANGYRNWRYGTNSQPSTRLGIVGAYLWPAWKRNEDHSLRHLPRVWRGARVLDVGLGNGAFLDRAKAAGWDVAGVDFDPVVIKNARARGLDVRSGGVEAFSDQIGSFDVITMNHVIEHLYDPVNALRAAHSMLKENGRLWIDTPNLESYGHSHFGRNWRGIEAPRHLVVFDDSAMTYALQQAGFKSWRYVNRSDVAESIFVASERMRLGESPYDESVSVDARLARKWRQKANFNRRRREYITLIAEKKGRGRHHE